MNKTVLIKRIENLCKERNITMNTAFLESGVGKNFKSNLKNANPTLGKLTLLALYFGVSREYLTGESNERGGRVTSPVKKRSVPILGSVACGAPIFAEESYDGYADVASDVKIDFCLFAKGDSMIDAGIRDGSVVFIKSQPTVENGQIAVVLIEDEATLKRVYYYPESNKLMLLSENSNYEPIVYVGEELESIHIIGKAVAFKSEIR